MRRAAPNMTHERTTAPSLFHFQCFTANPPQLVGYLVQYFSYKSHSVFHGIRHGHPHRCRLSLVLALNSAL